MQGSSTLPERIYGLTVADGRNSVRPHESIRLDFRIRNEHIQPTPAGRASFAIPPGWTALDSPEADLPALAAGEEFALALAARAGAADEEAGPFQVALVLPEGVLGSNIVRIAVRGRARFGAAASTLHLECGEGPDTIHAVATLVNEGDATARELYVRVPAPPGFRADARDDCAAAANVEPGATIVRRFTFHAGTVVAAPVRIDDACVVFSGGRDALVSDALALEAALAPPIVRIERTASHAVVAIRCTNAGVVAARDVPLRIAMPAGWRAVRGTLTLDDAPVSASVRGAVLTVDVPLLPARASVDLRFLTTARNARLNGALQLTWAGHELLMPIPAAHRRSARLALRCASAWTAPGEAIAVEALVWNDGATDERIALVGAGTSLATLDVVAGGSATARFTLAVPADAVPGEDRAPAIVAQASDGEFLATETIALRISATGARDDAADDTVVADVAPPVEMHWDVPANGVPGTPLVVALTCRFGAPVRTASIRPAIAAARYVAGSTRVNGLVVVDGPGEPALASPMGLVLHDIPAQSAVALTWCVLADGSTDLRPCATIDIDGTSVASTGPTVAVAAPAPFVQRPDELPFHVGATTLAVQPYAAVNVALARVPLAPPAAIRFGLRLDASRRATIARVLSGPPGPIVAHLPAFAALFPDRVDSADPRTADALALAGENIRGLYERLFVKLRIPGYDVGPYDLEDAPMRSSLVALLDGAAAATPAADEPFAELAVTLDGETLRKLRGRLTDAPLGGADAIGTTALLLPHAGTDEPAARALGAYVTLIVRELEAARSLAHDAFAAYLSMHALAALDEARGAALAALVPAVEPA